MGGSSITIARQGSFFVGGREVTATGTFDSTLDSKPGSAGQRFWVDQMYVQYQIPMDSRRLPLVFVHGGGGTGRVWETTPDGREGYQTIFLRRGFPVYIVDTPWGGRSGLPSFNGKLGELDDEQRLVPSRTRRSGREQAWIRWRIGPRHPEVFARQAFPMAALDQFLQHIRPIVSDDGEVTSQALLALLDKIGPAVIVTHSNSGLPGWLTAGRSSDVKGIISYEPGFVFRRDDLPPPLPLYKGVQAAGQAVGSAEFLNLSKIPIQVVYGDNIPTTPVPDLLADGRRAQVLTCSLFIDALNAAGGNASVLRLPDVGLRGNSRFMFSDLNKLDVADQMSAFLDQHGMGGR